MTAEADPMTASKRLKDGRLQLRAWCACGGYAGATAKPDHAALYAIQCFRAVHRDPGCAPVGSKADQEALLSIAGEVSP